MKLTEAINAKPTPREPLHVEEWLDQVQMRAVPGEAYARWWLEQARWPAWKKSLYAPIMAKHMLFCTYVGERMRCTGASRMGDVWMARDHARATGYDLRVNVEDCTEWSDAP